MQIEFIIIAAVFALIGLLFLGAYIYYIKTERANYLGKPEVQDIADLANIHSTLTMDWENQGFTSSETIEYRHNQEYDRQQDCWLILDEVIKKLEQKGFREIKTYEEEYDRKVVALVGNLGKQEVAIKLYGFPFMGEKLEDQRYHIDEDKQTLRRLSSYTIIAKDSNSAVEFLKQEIFKDLYRPVKLHPKKLDESTRVWTIRTEAMGGLAGVIKFVPRNTDGIFKFGRTLTECPMMFSKNIKWSFEGEKQEGFQPLEIGQMIEYLVLESPKIFSGIVFGAPGTGKTSLLNAYAWLLGKNHDIKVITVSGSSIANPDNLANVISKLKEEKDAGIRHFIVINEADGLLRSDSRFEDGKSVVSEQLMDIMDEFTCFLSCNLKESQLHPAFLREGRGSFLLHIEPLTAEQVAPINAYVKAYAEEEDSLVYEAIELGEAPTLAKIFSQLRPKGMREILEKIRSMGIKVPEAKTEKAAVQAVSTPKVQFHPKKNKR